MISTRPGGETPDPGASYDPTIVGLTFYTDDPEEPIAGFGERERLPIPEIGEIVRFADERLEDGADTLDADRTEQGYRVVDREFEYRRLEYDGFSGEGRRQVVVLVGIEVVPISEK